MRRFKFYLTLAFIFAFIPKGAAEDIEFVIDGIKYLYNPELSPKSCSVIASDKPYEGDIVIPENVMYEGLQLIVGAIYNNAFRDCTKLTSIVSPKTTVIGDSAFKDCINLTSIDLPQVIDINDHAFENCINLEGIDSDNISYIEAYAFKGCEKFTEFSAPAKTVGRYAFQGCTALKKISFPNLEDILIGTFDDCTSLSDIYLPKVKTIYPAFKNSWKGKLVLSDNIKYVNSDGRRVFEDCAVSSLDTGDVYDIPDSMFYNCDNLRDVFISKNT